MGTVACYVGNVGTASPRHAQQWFLATRACMVSPLGDSDACSPQPSKPPQCGRDRAIEPLSLPLCVRPSYFRRPKRLNRGGFGKGINASSFVLNNTSCGRASLKAPAND